MLDVLWCLQVRDLSVAYLLVGLTYLYVGVLIFAAFPSPPLSKDCIEPVRITLFFSLFTFGAVEKKYLKNIFPFTSINL